jgi:hypothetical protein
MSDFFSGYDPTIENRDEIRATSIDLGFRVGDFNAPEEIDPRPLMRHDKQLNMSSCQGFSLANACEYVWALAQGSFSAERQLSTLYAYLESQRLDGGRLFGVDKGSTISSGLKVATTIGMLPEADLPYRTPYPNNARTIVTDAMRTKAGQFKIRSHTWLESYDAIFQYLASGVGAVHTGTLWNDSFYARNGVLESISLRGGGGHATAWLGYSKRVDSRGRKYIWRLNSHNDSWTEIAPSVIDALCRHEYTSIVGVSDLSTPVPKPERVLWMVRRPLG